MYSARTEYRLANTPAAYKACHAFFKAEAQHPAVEKEGLATLDYQTERISSPTVYAIRDEKVVAVMATKLITGYGIVATPFHISYDLKNHVPTALRLIECYEFFLRKQGIHSYTVVLPNYKTGSIRFFTELRASALIKQVLDDRFDVLLVEVPEPSLEFLAE